MTRNKTSAKTATVDQIPPYCYRRPGMSAEAGAVVAVKELGITHLGDALAFLWELRREAKGALTDACLCAGMGGGEKAQQRPFVEADGETTNERNNA